MGMLASGKKGPKSDINITPYIDILLVLLIIFMFITPIRQKDLEVRPTQPPPPIPVVDATPDAIVVSIGDNSEIAVNQIPTEIAELGTTLTAIYRTRPNKSMFISASPTLPYGDVVKVIDISKSAGVGDIGLLSTGMR